MASENECVMGCTVGIRADGVTAITTAMTTTRTRWDSNRTRTTSGCFRRPRRLRLTMANKTERLIGCASEKKNYE
jgi:hypothetical protein